MSGAADPPPPSRSARGPTSTATGSSHPAPRPPTPGVGSATLYGRFAKSRPGRFAASGWAWRRSILFGFGATYALVRWSTERAKAKKRDTIHDKTYLYWKIYDGGIVEAKSTGSNLNYLLNSSQGGSDAWEPPRVMTLFDVIRAIKFIEQDDRIHGIVADFSNISVPTVPSYTLGLAQLEEIQDALLELRKVKQERLGPTGWRTVAWSDTFNSQGQYLFASAFDDVYTQPTGEVPLVGMGSTTPFFGKLIKWLGIDVLAEARNEYKSFVQPYIDEKLTKPQKENQIELISDLNNNLLTYIARNRFPTVLGQAGLDKVKELSQTGPYTASEAVKVGLLTGTAYRQDVLDSILEPTAGGDGERKVQGFYHYAKLMERAVEKLAQEAIEIGVVYLLGTIGEPGEFGTAAVVRGLKEAGEDESIGAVVLRIDSGGGGVVESDTIWSAVRDLREKYGKTVVASFGNASASGGYLVSTHTDAILAAPSTITGSIGVASLRPTFLQTFFDRFYVTLDSFFTGSRATDVTHKLSGTELERHKAHVDEMYADFKGRVVEGRGIHPDLIELIAGGRVMSGLTAFGLTAPPDLIAKIKGLEIENADASLPSTIMSSPAEDSEQIPAKELNRAAIVEISPDQENSPYAPPTPSEPQSLEALQEIESAEAEKPLPTPGSAIDVVPTPAETNAQQALETSSPSELAAPVKTSSIPKPSPQGGTTAAAGVYEVQPGPFGRGLVDGLGGIRDAAVYACELFISNGIAGYKQEFPEMSELDAVKELLPNTKANLDPDGNLTMQMDVRLKRFPVQKSFWQQLQEASQRGDSMEASLLADYIKLKAARWFLQLAAGAVSSELDDLGIVGSQAKFGLGGAGSHGIGNASRRGWMRAEWSGLNLR